VIEHTDPRWSDGDPAFAADHDRLRGVLAAQRAWVPAHQVDERRVAIGYMANIIMPQRFPAIAAAIGRAELGRLVRVWAAEFLDAAAAADAVDPAEDFLAFLRRVTDR
jgi:hypothetical protein